MANAKGMCGCADVRVELASKQPPPLRHHEVRSTNLFVVYNEPIWSLPEHLVVSCCA